MLPKHWQGDLPERSQPVSFSARFGFRPLVKPKLKDKPDLSSSSRERDKKIRPRQTTDFISSRHLVARLSSSFYQREKTMRVSTIKQNV
jgi:hypothetical protein